MRKELVINGATTQRESQKDGLIHPFKIDALQEISSGGSQCPCLDTKRRYSTYGFKLHWAIFL